MSAADFTAVRADARLHRLLTLARIVNTIRFAELVVVDQPDTASARATRQKMSAFLYLAAILYEALKFAERLGEHFRESEAFRQGLAPLFRDPQVKDLRAGLLNRLRNQAIYHHDDEAMQVGLEMMDADEYIFGDADGPTRADHYYTLADFAVIHFGIGRPSTPDTFREEFARALRSMVQVAIAFANGADDLISEALPHFGWRTRWQQGE